MRRKASSVSRFVLAIDGPAGSGKSTTARECAKLLGFHHLDTGAMYRAMTLKAIKESAECGVRSAKCGMRSAKLSEQALQRLLRSTTVGVTWRNGALRVSLDGRDVTQAIRAPEVSGLVSEVSAIPAVRTKMVADQRRIAQGKNVVCEGRDIGSVVFPDAELKVFLDCDIHERGRRRVRELHGSGVRAKETAVLANLAKRDSIDSSRKVAPLRRVRDAVLLDTTMLTIEEQVAVVCALVRRRVALSVKRKA